MVAPSPRSAALQTATLELQTRIVNLENTLDTQSAAMMRSGKPRGQITEASAALVYHDCPSVCSTAPLKTLPEFRYQSVRRKSGFTAVTFSVRKSLQRP